MTRSTQSATAKAALIAALAVAFVMVAIPSTVAFLETNSQTAGMMQRVESAPVVGEWIQALSPNAYAWTLVNQNTVYSFTQAYGMTCGEAITSVSWAYAISSWCYSSNGWVDALTRWDVYWFDVHKWYSSALGRFRTTVRVYTQ